MKDKKLNRKIESFTKVVFFLGSASFVFQFFLVPGVIWNFGLYGFLVFSLGIFLLSRKYVVRKKIILGAVILSLFTIGDLVWCEVNNEKLRAGNYSANLKVLTYNLSFRNKNFDAGCSVIRQSNPDILFVQELTPEWSEKLNIAIGNKYPYQEKIVMERSRGIGIYSKFKIGNSELLNNSRNKPYAQIVELQIIDKVIQLINVHLSSPQRALKRKDKFISRFYENYQTRKSELATINQFVDKESQKFDCQIFAGDFNTLKYEPIFKQLLYDWVNSFDQVGVGFGFNFPNTKERMALITIDYILLRGKAKCLVSKVLKGGDSDHLALETVIKI